MQTSTKRNSTCKLQTFWQTTRYTNYSPAAHSEPRKAKEPQNRSFHSSTLARTHAGKGKSGYCCNSQFRQAVTWCHTSQQITLNTRTLRPEAHVPLPCVFALSHRKQKPPGLHKLAKQNHCSSSSEFLQWHCRPIGKCSNELWKGRNRTQSRFDLLKRLATQAPTSHPTLCVA